MIAYDDAGSYCTSCTQLLIGYPLICGYKTVAKGVFIHNLGLAGFAMYEIAGDYDNILVRSIRSAMHMPP